MKRIALNTNTGALRSKPSPFNEKINKTSIRFGAHYAASILTILSSGLNRHWFIFYAMRTDYFESNTHYNVTPKL